MKNNNDFLKPDRIISYVFLIPLILFAGLFLFRVLFTSFFQSNGWGVLPWLFSCVAAVAVSVIVAEYYPLPLLQKRYHVISAVFATLLILTWQPDLYSTFGGSYQESSITITALPEKNESSKAHQVWILYYGYGNEYQDVVDFDLPEGWFVSERAIGTETVGFPLTLPIKPFPTRITFVTHDWSGIIKIDDGKKESVIDLYYDGFATYEYSVEGNYTEPGLFSRIFNFVSSFAFIFLIIYLIIPFPGDDAVRRRLMGLIILLRRILEKITDLANRSAGSRTYGKGLSFRAFFASVSNAPRFWRVLVLFISPLLIATLVFFYCVMQTSLSLIYVFICSGLGYTGMLFLQAAGIALTGSRIRRSDLLSFRRIILSTFLGILYISSIAEILNPSLTTTTITIQSSQLTNELSQNHEIWINKIVSDGRNIDLEQIPLPEEGWVYNGSIVAVAKGRPLNITLPGKKITVNFFASPYSGIAEIADGSLTKTIDLYSETLRTPSYHVQGQSSEVLDGKGLGYRLAAAMAALVHAYIIAVLLPLLPSLWGLVIPLFFWGAVKFDQTNLSAGVYLLLLAGSALIGIIAARKSSGSALKGTEASFSMTVKEKFALLPINILITYSLFAEAVFFYQGRPVLFLGGLATIVLFSLYLYPWEIVVFNFLSNEVGKVPRLKASEPGKICIAKVSGGVFLILIVIWGLFFYAYYPANMSADSYVQYFQATGEWPLDDWHPVYHTLFLRLLFSIWKNPAAATLFQLVFFAAVVTLFLSHFYRRGMKTGTVLRIAVLAAVFPPNGISTVTLWKDYPFTTALLWSTYLLIRYVEDPDCFDKSVSLNMQLIASSLAVALFRHNGLLIFFGLALFFGISALRNRRFQVLFSAGLMTVLVLNFQGPLLDRLDVAITSKPARYIAPLHDLYGVHAAGYDLTEDAEQLLFKAVPKEYWEENYNPYTAATIMFGNDYGYISSLADSSVSEVMGLYVRNFFRHPIPVAYNRLRSSALLWYIIPPLDGYSFRYIVSMDPAVDLGYRKNSNEVTSFLNDFLLASHSKTYLDVLFWRPAVYMFLLFVVTAFMFFHRGRRILIILIPLAGNLLSLLLSMSFQDFRYGYFIMVMTPFLLMEYVQFGRREVLDSAAARNRIVRKFAGFLPQPDIGKEAYLPMEKAILQNYPKIFLLVGVFFWFLVYAQVGIDASLAFVLPLYGIGFLAACLVMRLFARLDNRIRFDYLLPVLAFLYPTVVRIYMNLGGNRNYLFTGLSFLSLLSTLFLFMQFQQEKHERNAALANFLSSNYGISLYFSLLSAILIRFVTGIVFLGGPWSASFPDFLLASTRIGIITGIAYPIFQAAILHFSRHAGKNRMAGSTEVSDLSEVSLLRMINVPAVPERPGFSIMTLTGLRNSILSIFIALGMNRISGNQPVPERLTLMIAAAFWVYGTLYLFKDYLLPFTRRWIGAAAIAAALASGIAAAILYPGLASPPPILQPEITVTLQEQINPDSKGREVWIQSVMSKQNGAEISEVFEVLPPTWQIQPENAWIFTTVPSSPLVVQLSEPATIHFLSHPWSGMVMIEEGALVRTIDLYSPDYQIIVYESVYSGDQTNADTYNSQILTMLFVSACTYLFLLMTIRTPSFIVVFFGLALLIAISAGSYDINILSNSGPGANKSGHMDVQETDRNIQFPEATRPFSSPEQTIRPGRGLAERMVNEVVYASSIFPIRSDSWTMISHIERVNQIEEVHFIDFLLSERTEYHIYQHDIPFIFSEGNPFTGARSYLLRAAAAIDQSIAEEGFNLAVSFLLGDSEADRAYHIRGVDSFSSSDQTQEYIYLIAEERPVSIDGLFDDWQKLPFLVQYEISPCQPAIERKIGLKTAVRDGSIYFQYSLPYCSTEENELLGSYPSLLIFFDTDNNPETGFPMIRLHLDGHADKVLFGCDSALIGSYLLYHGESDVTASVFGEILSGYCVQENGQVDAEFAIPFEALPGIASNHGISNLRMIVCIRSQGGYRVITENPILLSFSTVP